MTDWDQMVDDMGPKSCAFAGVGGCYGPIEVHHVIPKRVLRSHFERERWIAEGNGKSVGWLLEEALADERNLLPLCRETHHERVTNARLYVSRLQLPEGCLEFADSVGLGWWVDRHFERSAATIAGSGLGRFAEEDRVRLRAMAG